MKIYRKLSDILFFSRPSQRFVLTQFGGLLTKSTRCLTKSSRPDKGVATWKQGSAGEGVRGRGGRAKGTRDLCAARRDQALSGGSVWSDCEHTIDEAREETPTLTWGGRCVVLTRRERVTCGDICGRLVTTPPAPAATTDPPLFPRRGFIFAEYKILCLPAKRPSGLKNDARRRGRLICSVLQTDSLG